MKSCLNEGDCELSMFCFQNRIIKKNYFQNRIIKKIFPNNIIIAKNNY